MATSAELHRPEVAPRAAGRGLRAAATSGPACFAVAVLLIAVLSRPLLLGFQSAPQDWYPHLWFAWHQAHSLQANGVPSLFEHNTSSMFDAHFAFYGGTLYTLAAALSLLVGSITVAYTAMFILAFAAALGGWYWLARMAGLGRWWALVPGALLITSPYYLALVYVRGGWPELTAVSIIPLLVAATLSVLRADRLRPLPALGLAVSGVVFFGSHNITLLWGGCALVITAVALLALVPAARRQVTRAGMLRVAALLVPAVMVNAWFLLPDLVYQSHTYVGARPGDWRTTLRMFDPLVAPGNLFALGRATSNPAVPKFALQLPVLAAAWVALTVVVVRPRWASPWTRTLLVLATVTAAFVVLITNTGVILALPDPFAFIQYSFRLESYILLGAAGMVLAALVLAVRAPGRRSRWAWVVLPVLAVSVVQGAMQIDMRRTATSNPTTWADAPRYLMSGYVPGSEDYVGFDLPQLGTDTGLAPLRFPAGAEDGDRATVVAKASPGELLVTNARAIPQLVHLDGARFVGVDPTLHNVIEVADDATPGAARITLRAAHPWPVVVGWIVSLLGLAGLAATAITLALRRWRREKVVDAGA